MAKAHVADEQHVYAVTRAELPYPNTQALGPPRYTIMQEFSRGCIGGGTTTTTLVKESGETEVRTMQSLLHDRTERARQTEVHTIRHGFECILKWQVHIPLKVRKSITFHDELIVVKEEVKLACYPWQFTQYAIPKHHLVSMYVTKTEPLRYLVAAFAIFILGVVLLSEKVPYVGGPLLFVAVITVLIPFLYREYYIQLRVNEGKSRVRRHTFTVAARPDTEFLERYIYGPLGKSTESLHALALLNQSGMMASLGLRGFPTAVGAAVGPIGGEVGAAVGDAVGAAECAVPTVALANLAHQPPPEALGAASGGAGSAGALGGLLCEMRNETEPLFKCCGPAEDNSYSFHQGGVRIEAASRFVPYPEGFKRLTVPKHRVLGCQVQKVVDLFLRLGAALVAVGLLVLIIGAVSASTAVIIGGVIVGVIFGGACLCAPFLKYFQRYYVWLDITEGSRRWVHLCLDDEPDADFVFRYVYGPLMKWSGAYHCQAHLASGGLVKKIKPSTEMAVIHPPLSAPVSAGKQQQLYPQHVPVVDDFPVKHSSAAAGASDSAAAALLSKKEEDMDDAIVPVKFAP